jgi:hypothetical protein
MANPMALLGIVAHRHGCRCGSAHRTARHARVSAPAHTGSHGHATCDSRHAIHPAQSEQSEQRAAGAVRSNAARAGRRAARRAAGPRWIASGAHRVHAQALRALRVLALGASGVLCGAGPCADAIADLGRTRSQYSGTCKATACTTTRRQRDPESTQACHARRLR